MKKIAIFFIVLLTSCSSPTKSKSPLQSLILNDFNVVTNEDVFIDIALQKYRTDGTTLTYTIVTDAAMGTTSISGNIITYLPTENYNGTDTFTFKANDGTDDSNVSTVTIPVAADNADGGNDTIYGTDDEDTLYGEAGNDILDGGDGDGRFFFYGGGGNDIFVIRSGDGSSSGFTRANAIYDFEDGVDQIALSRRLFCL